MMHDTVMHFLKYEHLFLFFIFFAAHATPKGQPPSPQLGMEMGEELCK